MKKILNYLTIAILFFTIFHITFRTLVTMKHFDQACELYIKNNTIEVKK